MILWIMHSKTVATSIGRTMQKLRKITSVLAYVKHIAKILQTKGRDRTTVLNKTACDTIWKAIKCFSVKTFAAT